MKMRSTKIEFLSALPPRERALDGDELSRIFGGCGGFRALCQANADCCLVYTCFMNRCVDMST
jgi:hypothetical protein